MSLFEEIREQGIQFPAIVMSCHTNAHVLIAALTKCAEDYLIQPISVDVLYGKCLRISG